ncbi:hypothetical protein FHR87_002699 [Azomonas macrocytogenes]|uniref:Uncharacterized protein n=1 Tax=Azomonas macrocytogenes TaxID=69962 RepID=A0A839T7Q3_AZOMA|nr:hypothetical protein [Azomonas macrocytogenes]
MESDIPILCIFKPLTVYNPPSKARPVRALLFLAVSCYIPLYPSTMYPSGYLWQPPAQTGHIGDRYAETWLALSAVTCRAHDHALERK